MLLQLANVVAGFVLASGWLSKIPNVGKGLADFAKTLNKSRSLIGIITLILGVLNLIERFFFYIPYFYGSFPQSIIAILMGLIMSADLLKGNKTLMGWSKSLAPYQEFIGVAGVIIGLYSII